MSNPYKPPESKIITSKESGRYYPPVGWKIYFWFTLVMMLLIIGLLISDSNFRGNYSFTFLDILDFIIWSISLLAIFGLAWSRKFFSRRFWRIYMAGFVGWFFIYSIVAAFVLQIPQYGNMSTLSDLLYGIPFFLLTLWGLYRYTASMEDLWNDSTTA